MYKIERADPDAALEANKKWKDNQAQPLTSEAFVEVEYNITNPNSPDASLNKDDTNEALYFCNAIGLNDSSVPSKLIGAEYHDVIASKDVTPYATLEDGRWLLDGSMVTAPELPAGSIYDYCGYASKTLCGADCKFTPIPVTVSIDFGGQLVNILPGLTIVWDATYEEYAKNFTVTSYNGDKELQFYSSVGDNNKSDGPVSVVQLQMENFNRIHIQVLEWSHPNRRARISKIFMGLNKVYGKTELLKFSCSESIDPISASLPKYEIQFDINNKDKTYNPTNPNSLTAAMMERQEVRTWYSYKLGDSIERIPGGVYYLSEWSAPQNGLSASFKARDLLSFLNMPYYKGVFPGAGGNSLYALAEQVLTEARLPNDRNGNPLWEICEDLREIKTNAPLPVCSMAECLQLIANAACYTLSFDRTGKLHIAPLENPTPEMEINHDNSYTKAEINLATPIKQFDISVYSYEPEDKEKELYKGSLELNEGLNEFVLEYSDLTKTATASANVNGTDVTIEKGKLASGVTVEDIIFYAKCCVLTLEAPQDTSFDVVVKGTAIKPAETVVTIQNSDEHANTEEPNPLQKMGETLPLKNNTLITGTQHAQNVGNWLKANLKYRKHFNMDWRIDPRLDAGDIVTIRNGVAATDGSNANMDKTHEDAVTQNTMRVTSSSFSFNGAFKGKSEGMEVELPESEVLV